MTPLPQTSPCPASPPYLRINFACRFRLQRHRRTLAPPGHRLPGGLERRPKRPGVERRLEGQLSHEPEVSGAPFSALFSHMSDSHLAYYTLYLDMTIEVLQGRRSHTFLAYLAYILSFRLTWPTVPGFREVRSWRRGGYLRCLLLR